MNWLIILKICFIICGLIYIFYPVKESMRSKPIPKLNIVFLGDYILHEPESQKYPSIKEMFKAKFTLASVKSFTSECKTLEKFKNEISKMPKVKYNTPNTYFFLSVGSGAIHKNLINCSKVYDIKPTQMDSGKRSTCLSSQQLKEGWITQINILRKKFEKAKIIIIGSYYPKKGDKIKICGHSLDSNNMLHENIETWNQDITEYINKYNQGYNAKNNEISFISLENVINSDKDLEKDGITIKPKSVKKLAKILFHEIK